MSTTVPTTQFSDQAPVMSLEWAILDQSHRLVGHLRQMRASADQQEVSVLVNQVEWDIKGVQDMLRVARDEAKTAQEGKVSPMTQAFREAAHQRSEEEQRH